MRRVIHASITAVLVLCARSAAAQDGSSLVVTPGTEVRLTPRIAGAPRMRGRVVVLARDTIVLRDDAALSRTALRDLSAIEVRGGEDKRRGFLIGAGVATAITGVAGGIDVSKGNISGGDFVGTLLFNALIGGLVGYAFAPKGWERIPMPNVAP
jgi:hypothetical protein